MQAILVLFFIHKQKKQLFQIIQGENSRKMHIEREPLILRKRVATKRRGTIIFVIAPLFQYYKMEPQITTAVPLVATMSIELASPMVS